MRARAAWLGLAFSVFFIYMAARAADWGQTFAALAAADWPLVTLGSAALAGTFVVFAARWRLLLATSSAIPLRRAFSYVMVGYLANTVLPLRLGDVARAGMVARREGRAMPAVLASIFVERLLDLTMLLLLALVLSFGIDVPPLVRTGMAVMAGGSLAGLVTLVVLGLVGSAGLGRLAGFVPAPALVLVSRFADAVVALRRGGRLGEILALTGAAWALAGAGTALWVRGFHLGVPWYAGIFVVVVVNLGGAIPSSPGAIGVYHYLAMLALSVWAPDQSAALAYAIGTHGINVSMNVLLGVGCLVAEGVGRAPLRAALHYRSVAPTSGAAPL